MVIGKAPDNPRGSGGAECDCCSVRQCRPESASFHKARLTWCSLTRLRQLEWQNGDFRVFEARKWLMERERIFQRACRPDLPPRQVER